MSLNSKYAAHPFVNQFVIIDLNLRLSAVTIPHAFPVSLISARTFLKNSSEYREKLLISVFAAVFALSLNVLSSNLVFLVSKLTEPSYVFLNHNFCHRSDCATLLLSSRRFLVLMGST